MKKVIVAYLLVIVAANLLTTKYGPNAAYVNAALFIGFDLLARDWLHEKWQTHRALRIGTLIAAGSGLSYLVNSDAGPIALASCIAFFGAGVADSCIYTILRKYPWLIRSNGSTAVGSAVDSLLFPTIAFGAFALPVVLGHFAAKTAGGFVWSLVLRDPVSR